MRKNKPLAFIPGLFETSAIWQPTITRLELPISELVCLELGGHDPTDRVIFDVDRWVERAAAKIFPPGLTDKVTLVCHSTGGLLGLVLAKRYPRRVDSLVLVGSLTCGHRGKAVMVEQSILASDVLGPTAFSIGWRMWLASRRSFEVGLQLATSAEAASTVPDEMRVTLQKCDTEALRSMTNWVLKTSILDDLAEIDVPILGIVGRRDHVVPPEHQLQLIKTASGAQGCLLDAGHLPFLESPSAFDKALRGWLQFGPARQVVPASAAPTDLAELEPEPFGGS
ncbi:alpha/beta fold hydrolase [Yoonia sp. 2307UL14-13]|uniref:alpha/beta fold hydrolase n=1 Tax=Yoonia sp. 2307UL14-13 TaxID=3126506 RepID=UPI0030A8BF5B